MTVPPLDRYMITGQFTTNAMLFERINRALAQGIRLIQFRAAWLATSDYIPLAQALSDVVRAAGARLIIKGDHTLLAQSWCHGLHLTSDQLAAIATGQKQVQKHDNRQLLAASCHDATEINQAQAVSADFITLSPIHPTPSHPASTPLGLAQAAKLTTTAAMPVFWLGGMTTGDIATTQRMGACGIAAIREFWCQ